MSLTMPRVYVLVDMAMRLKDIELTDVHAIFDSEKQSAPTWEVVEGIGKELGMDLEELHAAYDRDEGDAIVSRHLSASLETLAPKSEDEGK